MAEILDCVHGIDLLWPCFECESEANRIAKEYDMQTSGTFPQLNRTDSVTRPTKGGGRVGKSKSGSKKGGGKGC